VRGLLGELGFVSTLIWVGSDRRIGRLPDGGFGYIDGMSPERVEAQGERAVQKNCSEGLGAGICSV
jgi:hypothetical protein